MFKDKSFYNQHIRKAIISFGTIFNDINIERKNSAGAVTQALRVPLSYSTKQKFMTRIARVQDTTTRGEVALTLPRMGFEINGLNYDPARKVGPIQKTKVVGTGDDSNTVRQVFSSAPWNMDLALYIFAKNQDDGLQILEQIIPYFNPDFNVTDVLDFPNNHFDMIQSHMSWCWHYPKEIYYNEVLRILKPNGLLVVDVWTKMDYTFNEFQEIGRLENREDESFKLILKRKD